MKIVLICFSFLLCFSFPAFAGSITIQGTKAECPGAHVEVNNRLDNLGETEIHGRSLQLNLRAMSRLPKNVQLFVFYHECGHTKVGANEFAADCWGINQGVTQGWLTDKDLKPICDSWNGNPETDTHPSARRRCLQINKCFKSITAKAPVKKDTAQHGNAYGFKPEHE